jgi:hypothetical protein
LEWFGGWLRAAVGGRRVSMATRPAMGEHPWAGRRIQKAES